MNKKNLDSIKKAVEDDSRSDVERAKEKAKRIREQGIQKYKNSLLKELEADRNKKLCVVNFLWFLTILILSGFYYAKNWIDLDKLFSDTVHKFF